MDERKPYLTAADDVIETLKSGDAGLTTAEADARIQHDGKNKLKEAKKQSIISRFFAQMADPMIIVLLAAALLSGITAWYEGDSFTDVFIIVAVVLINAVLGVYQESKAEAAIEALQEMTAATCKVMRDGKSTVIRTEELAVGDIVLLEAGDSVPADGRIIESASLKIEEAALTGESVPANKDTDALMLGELKDIPLGDRSNMMYMGSTVVYGRGRAVITGTGMNTEMGKIADALEAAEDGKTPLQIKLSQLSKILTVMVLAICVFMFAFDIIRDLANGQAIGFESLLDTFMIAISLAVAAIPEGLAAVVTIVLSIGVTNMSKRNAVIRRLTAVETLGCAQIICSDKTGTLTQNKMTVVKHVGDDETLLARAMALASDAELDENNNAKGEPTECALVNYAYKTGLDKNELKRGYPRVAEAPFDSMRKMMSTVHNADGKIVQYTKGAPDEVLKLCTHALVKGERVIMTDAMRAEIMKSNKAMADEALRVLMAAYREYDSIPSDESPEFLEHDLTYIGLCGMIDPVRPEVKAAIEECRAAGIRPIMITGDHRDTAVAIAKELGIITDASEAITGADIDAISDEDFGDAVKKYSVYARVQPEHKVRIVNAWRSHGMITAMTGDGVNDAPSIKSADIGVGMGITGTDVTKNVADMVLADDNFATIVSAVGEGRRIYDNIRKSIQFLLSSNLSEVISIFVATIMGFTILRPVHLLWINLITDCFPALALGMEPGENDLMKREPRSAKDGIFAGGMAIDCLWQGAMVSVLTIAAYFIGHFNETGSFIINDGISSHGMTMAFMTMSMAEIFHSFNMRSRRGSIFAMKKQNVFLWGSMAASLILTTCAAEIPFLSKAFEFEPVGFEEYAIAMGLAISVIPIVEIVKLIQRAVVKRKK